VRRYLLYLINEAKAAPGTVNTYAAAIRILYSVTLERPDVVADVVRLKVPMRVPRVLRGTEVGLSMRRRGGRHGASWRS
jgi:hypothetical protein